MARKPTAAAPRHVAVTGASSGIGEAIARAYARAGSSLTLVARRKERLDALAAEVDVPSHVAAADLADLATCTDWIAGAEAALGPIDVLVLNAGIQYVEPALGVSDERANAIMALNLLAPIHQAHAVAPGMCERGGGAIVVVASVSAWTHVRGMAHYCASKAGVAAYFETLRVETQDQGLHVMTVYPGPVATPMEAAAREQIPKTKAASAVPVGTPDVLATRICEGVAKKKERLVYPRFYETSRYARVTTQWITDRFAPDV